MTLCGSDAIGLRTLYNPLEAIINRPVAVPQIDLKSPQVVQRHVNSFLIRYFKVFSKGAKGGSLNQKVVDFYTPFTISYDGGHMIVVDGTPRQMTPSDMLGNLDCTLFKEFNIECEKPISTELREALTILLKDTVFENRCKEVVDTAKKENERCYKELSSKVFDYKYAFEDKTRSFKSNRQKEKFYTKLKLQYYEVLNQRLLSFWSTSRFTPNANMPVNVLSFDINTTEKKYYTSATTSNPSYSLREAIAQYAPGNSIIVDGVVYTVRGIEYTNFYQGVNNFKKIYRNMDKTVIGETEGGLLSSKIMWNVNKREDLELVQPVSFVPDMNERKSRIMESNTYTRVSAQLIDTEDWDANVKAEEQPQLYSVRNNRDTGNAKILYYNEGLGYGYCLCPMCGKMVLETEVAEDKNTKLPFEMNDRYPKDKDKPKYHLAIKGREAGKYCSNSTQKDKYKRNVIIGDLIQTDYSEVRIRHKGMNRWISNRDDELKLLYTLAIVFTQSLADVLGKERNAIDFAIMPNGHICVFDTNPGGAGYSNQLKHLQIMKRVILSSKEMLTAAKKKNSKDMLLDKFTLRYTKYLDIDAALNWILEVEELTETMPQNIKDAFPGSIMAKTTLYDMKKAFEKSVNNLILFADNDYKQWDYDNDENGWQPHLMNSFVMKGQTTSFCIVESGNNVVPEPIVAMCREMRAWARKGNVKIAKNPWGDKGIYPIAYIDDCLYFTNKKERAQLNVQWGNDEIFLVGTNNLMLAGREMDLSYKPNMKLYKITGDEHKEIYTNELGKILQEHSGGLVDKFIDYAKQHGGKLKIEYQDEHLKSVTGMLITLQTIEHIIKEIGNDFTIEFKLEQYRDDRGYADSITANQPSHTMRDKWLTDLSNAWFDDLRCTANISGNLVPIVSLGKNVLSHWRALTISCGNKQLVIYPDGGFINGWSIGKQPNRRFYNAATITHDTYIYIHRCNEIKFDIILEDC